MALFGGLFSSGGCPGGLFYARPVREAVMLAAALTRLRPSPQRVAPGGNHRVKWPKTSSSTDRCASAPFTHGNRDRPPRRQVVTAQQFKGRSRVPHFYSRALQSSCHALRQQLVVDAERAIRRLGPSVARDEQEFVLAGCGADKTVIERGAGQARFG